MPPAPSTMIMNSTRARCVIAHWERLKPFTVRPPVCLVAVLTRLDRPDPRAGHELLHAQGHDLVPVRNACGDERRLFRERGDFDRPQRERAALVDHVDGRPGAAIEDGGER